MSPLTLYLGRVFGLGCLLMCGTLAARPKSSIAALNALVDNAGFMLVTGIVTLAAGIACVVGHNLWSGGVLAVAVTALGWATLIKGLALIAVPPDVVRRAYAAIHYPQRFGAVMALGALAGAGLTFLAFQA